MQKTETMVVVLNKHPNKGSFIQGVSKNRFYSFKLFKAF